MTLGLRRPQEESNVVDRKRESMKVELPVAAPILSDGFCTARAPLPGVLPK